jgi:hypothetical protein
MFASGCAANRPSGWLAILIHCSRSMFGGYASAPRLVGAWWLR